MLLTPMTRVKSLKYQVERQGHGHVHRIHRSKKNRRYFKKSFDDGLDVKLRAERVKKYQEKSFQQTKRRLLLG